MCAPFSSCVAYASSTFCEIAKMTVKAGITKKGVLKSRRRMPVMNAVRIRACQLRK